MNRTARLRNTRRRARRAPEACGRLSRNGSLRTLAGRGPSGRDFRTRQTEPRTYLQPAVGKFGRSMGRAWIEPAATHAQPVPPKPQKWWVAAAGYVRGAGHTRGAAIRKVLPCCERGFLKIAPISSLRAAGRDELMVTADVRGFADPVFDAQHVFKTAMMALARPGSIHQLAVALRPPSPLSRGSAALALSLCDFETLIWLDGHLTANPDVASFLRFHTGARFVENRHEASFAFVGDAAQLNDLRDFSIGTLEYPDRSATLVVEVCHLFGDTIEGLVLSGAGIEGSVRLDAGPAVSRLKSCLIDNHKLFPRGIDVIFVAGDKIAAVPRSTQLAV
jgi:alpha-D-ribose 1-methylphosphonate 5-triphosphate synthase subunit PhnH